MNANHLAVATSNGMLRHSGAAHENASPLVLVVDDDRALLMFLEEQITRQGYRVLTAREGLSALEIIEEQGTQIDSILLDREMPVMNGIEVVRQLKNNKQFRHIPIIMQTGSNLPEQIREGIDAGVFYYLTKPLAEDLLVSVLASAIRESRQHKLLNIEMRRHRTSFSLIESCRFLLSSLPEAEDLACFLANCFPDPERAIVGLAELLVNAVEHGNLGITYEEKTQLIKTNTWLDEVIARGKRPPYADRQVEVVFQHKSDGMYVQITDDGAGFDWRNYLQIDPSRATDNHGRGIAQANLLSFDALKYNDKGNQVLAVMYTDTKKSSEIKW